MTTMANLDATSKRLTSVRIVGAGRAGGSFAGALASVGLDVEVADRHDLSTAAADVDLVMVCTPDDVIAEVARSIDPGPAVVAHCSGSRRLEVLAPHERRCSVHPLMSLPNPTLGAARLLDGCRFAVTGDPAGRALVDLLRGIAFNVADDDRAAYHATASVAANHLVALCAEVEALAGRLDIDPAGFWRMMQTTLADVAEHGATAALTGPVTRGDWATVRAHLDALEKDQREPYIALARVAARVAGRVLPSDLI
jgi:predicted short-subunit dehydrogenase-like oxidoreductase (DUF2520 family)|tara:strand:+ start:2479 stop:3240 length:762 start_codon:yes stop_codon:yes gene_type:complete